MTVKPTNSIWIQRVQCPCGEWKCSVKFEEDERGEISQSTENGTSSSLLPGFVFTPYVGQIFESDTEAYEFYSGFARKNGFSIRKARSTESHNLGVYRRDFVCYRSGFNQPRKKANVERPRDRKSVRCGCDAKLYLTKETVNGIGQWYVSQFSNVHNHELLGDDQVRLLPAYRKIEEADQERILLLSKAGFPINRIMKALELEKGVQPGQLPFLEKDVRNFIRSCKKTVLESDSYFSEKRVSYMLELLHACRSMAEMDEEFAFDFTEDAKGKVENIAWSNGDSVRAFGLYGDVVLFDITYQSITYGLLLGVFSGINSSGKPIFYGFILFQEESSHAIRWALQAFVRFMRGRHPQTIVTDLDLGLRDPIATELPNTKHVVASWYIMSRLSSWFSLPLGLQFSEVKTEFEILCSLESVDDFEHHWNQLIARFGLGADTHTSLLSAYRDSWAFSYIKECYVARITTTEYMQSLSTYLNEALNALTCWQAFFKQVGQAMNCGYSSNEESRSLPLKTCMPIEEHAQSLLTPYAFNLLQNELMLSPQYAITEMAKDSYVVRHYKKIEGERLLLWIPENEQIHCSCKAFEHSGILCRHALRFLVTKNYFQVPDKYLPFRWRLDCPFVPMDVESSQSLQDECSHTLQSLTDTLVAESLISKVRFNFAHRELRIVLDHVKNMPDHDVSPDTTSNNANDLQISHNSTI